MKIRRVEPDSGGPAHYVFEDVSETDLQIFDEAFKKVPYVDIPELRIFSADIARRLKDSVDDLTERYR